MTDRSKVFDLYSAGAAAAPASTLEEYRAAAPFLADEERHYIMVYMSDGAVRLVSTFFNEVVSVAPDRLAFVYSNGALFLRGNNVRALLPLLQSRSVKELHPFDETRHQQPEEGAAVIDTLDWRYPEEVRSEAA